jgi:methionyl-tRNA formyltransferase
VVPASGKTGTIVEIGKEGFVVACATQGLLIKKVQPEAGKLMTAYDFIQGHRLKLADEFL